MNKTRFQAGVWAASRILVQDELFPTLWRASSVRRAADAKFQYNWKQWLSELDALGPRAPPCRRMIAVLSKRYTVPQMLLLAPQLSRAVIELELRRSEAERRLAHGSHRLDNEETKLMTRVRSAATHKEEPVVTFITEAIKVAGNEPFPSNVPSDSSPSPGSESTLADKYSPLGLTANSLAMCCIQPPQVLPELEAPFDIGGFEQLEQLLTVPPEQPCLVNPAVAQNDASFATIAYGDVDVLAEPVPGLCSLMGDLILGRSDPLYLAVHLCQLGQASEAVNMFKRALECSDLAGVSEQANRAGLTPWHLMWLRLGEAIIYRKQHGMLPAASDLLCELDVVFAELECEREYGDFGAAAHATLRDAISRGNFAALATKGLLLLDGYDEPGSQLDVPTREKYGLDLVLEAALTDPCTVPRLLVARLTTRTRPLLASTVEYAVSALRKRAATSSVLALHVGALLSHEQAADCGYDTDPRGAREMLRSCLAGIFVPSALRLQCARRLGHLAAYVDVDLSLAGAVLGKGAEARDPFCIAHLAALYLRQKQGPAAALLFKTLLNDHEERELYVSALAERNGTDWVTYRFYLAEAEEDRFLNEVSNGVCYPTLMTRERAASYGELMTIEIHDRSLIPTSR